MPRNERLATREAKVHNFVGWCSPEAVGGDLAPS